uniref:RING-type E3 ubiquitin transferase n=1 Tax=Sinocyclocheilus grahami TaxID=75366 RepID=A0A672PU65_SINGR
MSLCKEQLVHEEKQEAVLSTLGDTGRKSRAVCGVCSRTYRDPKILPCLHTFCADCIRQLEPFSVRRVNGERRSPEDDMQVRNSGSTILCPECDSEVDLPPSGVDGLTIDHLALDEVFAETLLVDCRVLCDLCSESDAGKRCEVCCVSLCDFCSQAHRRQKRTTSHSIQSLQELKSQGRLTRPVLCSLHPGQELRLFCESCDFTVCLECAATFHHDHHCSSAHEVISHHGDRIRDLVFRSLRPHLARLEDSLRRVDTSQEVLQTRTDTLAGEIRAFARSYARAVEAHCCSLLRSLEDLRLQRRNQLHLQKAQLQQALSDVCGGVDFAERLLTCGSDAEILSAKGVTMRRLMNLSAGEVQGFPVVGVVHATTVDPSKCTIQGEGVEGGREGQRGEFTLLCRDSSGEQMGRGGDPVLVSIVHKERKGCSVEAAVVDNGDGSYGVSYTPAEAGLYSVWVCVKAQDVKGSPFALNVKRKFRCHRGMFHCCSFCSSGGTKEARCGCTGTMPGGFQGCGHGHTGHPGKPHWSCCGSVVEASECILHNLSCVSPRGHLRTVEL